MTLAPGTRLGPYEIVAPAGVGGMGEVYRARDTRLEREVAIKVLPAHLSGSPELKQRFEREARAISSLQHPHICTLFDVGQQDGTDFLVMEYLEGESLAKRLERGPLPLEQALRIASEIADALDKAHRRGLVHRDLKPGNIMLTRSGAKLMDFGLAKPVAGAAVASATALPAFTAAPTLSSPASPLSPLTAAGTVLGTFQYMSPEQVQGREADARSDLFSFGCVLYEMVTGRRAFEGKSQLSVASAILEKEPEPLTSLQPLTPKALERVVNHCLAKDPDERWQSAHDLKLELKSVFEGGTQAPATAAGRNRLAWALVALLAVGLVGLAGSTLWRKPPSGPVMRFNLLPPEGQVFDSIAGPSVISADGRYVAFIATDASGADRIWVREVATSTARAITEPVEEPYDIFWSADSRYIGYFSKGKLKKVAAAGGPPQVVAAVTDGRGGSWNEQNEILFAATPAGPLSLVSADGGEVRQVTSLDTTSGEIAHWRPNFLPDGRRFLFTVRRSDTETREIYAGSLDTKETVRLLTADSEARFVSPGYLLFVRGGLLMAQRWRPGDERVSGQPITLLQDVEFSPVYGYGAFAASSTGVLIYHQGGLLTSQFAWVDRAGKQTSALPGTGDYRTFSLSPDESKLAVEMVDAKARSSDIWIMDLQRGITSRLTSTFWWEAEPVWSPDGTRLAYRSNLNSAGDLYAKSILNPEQEEPVLRSAEIEKRPLDWSSDGKFLIFLAPRPGESQMDLWLLPSGSDTPTVFRPDRFNQYDARISPDGRWIAYVSDDSGRPEVYVASFPDGQRRWQISNKGGGNPRWRRDGKELFYLDGGADGNAVTAVPVRVAGGQFEAGVPRPLFTSRSNAFDVSRDGQRFLLRLPVAESQSLPLQVVVNWTSALEE